MRTPRKPRQRAFTLIELLVVIGVIAVLAGMLLPVAANVRLAARVSRAHGELKQITVALQLYSNRFNVFPPAYVYCESMTGKLAEYNHLPPELLRTRCIDSLPEDIFNQGHTYKYLAPGFGWANYNPSWLSMKVPAAFPDDTGWDDDKSYVTQDTSPVKCALWSVGPSGAKIWSESKMLHYPMPPRHWYPDNKDGIIVHYYYNDCWQSSP